MSCEHFIHTSGGLWWTAPHRGYRHLQLSCAAMRARHCIIIMSCNTEVKAVPATVHGEGVWLHNYPLSALRTVRYSASFEAMRSGRRIGGRPCGPETGRPGRFYCQTDPSEWPRRSAAASGAAGLVYYSRKLGPGLGRATCCTGGWNEGPPNPTFFT